MEEEEQVVAVVVVVVKERGGWASYLGSQIRHARQSQLAEVAMLYA